MSVLVYSYTRLQQAIGIIWGEFFIFMIDPQYFDQFKKDATSEKYLKLKPKVKQYIDSRYAHSTKSPVSVYSVRVGFQMVIGDIPQSALSYWLQEWGYKVEPSKGVGSDGNHNVYVKNKPLLHDSDEEHHPKEWKSKRKGSIVY